MFIIIMNLEAYHITKLNMNDDTVYHNIIDKNVNHNIILFTTWINVPIPRKKNVNNNIVRT